MKFDKKAIFKRIMSFVLAFVMIFGAAPLDGLKGIDFKMPHFTMPGWIKAFAAEPAPERFTEGIFTYTVTNGEATIVGCDNTNASVVVPSTIGGYPVITIGETAFKSWNSSITDITMSEGIKKVEAGAFYGCYNLKKLDLQTQ